MKERRERGRRKAALYLSAVLSACCAVLIPAACRRQQGSEPAISVKSEIAPQPPHVGPATVTIRLADAATQPVSHATVSIEGDMTHPGMSPVFADAKETAPGNYQAPLTFTMGGDWVLLLHIQLADGKKIERQVSVNGVRSK